MVSRRHVLRLGAAALAGSAGCVGRPGDTPADTASPAPTESPSTPTETPERTTRTPEGLPEWTPEWTMPFEGWNVVGLDAADGLLYATLSRESGRSAVAAVDPAGRSVRWQTASEGEAVAGSAASYRHLSRGQWGVTLAGDTVYTVAGPAEEREWSAVHALARAGGERRWSLRRPRRLAVAGVANGLVVATGAEFSARGTPEFTQTPTEPLSTVVYGLDADTGTVRWSREFLEVRDVAVADESVYVAAADRLVGLDPDGTTRFAYERGPATRVEATAGRVFYLSGAESSATLHGLAPDGSADWQHALPLEELLLDGERLYAGGEAVVAVAEDGTVAWREDAIGQWLLLDPDRDTLYTRSGRRADAATAYDVTDGSGWTFDPPSTNAWPEAATREELVVTAITADETAFLTVYAVDGGEATAALRRDTVFDAVGVDGTVYLGDGVSNLVALEP